MSFARRGGDDPDSSWRLLTALPLTFVPSPYTPGIAESVVSYSVAAVGVVMVALAVYRSAGASPRLTSSSRSCPSSTGSER